MGFTLCGLAADNGAGVTRYLVTTDHVKQEMMTQWRALQKNEVLLALKEAKVSERKVCHKVVGDTRQFTSYLPFPNYAENGWFRTIVVKGCN